MCGLNQKKTKLCQIQLQSLAPNAAKSNNTKYRMYGLICKVLSEGWTQPISLAIQLLPRLNKTKIVNMQILCSIIISLMTLNQLSYLMQSTVMELQVSILFRKKKNN